MQHAPRRLTTQMWATHNATSYSYVFNVLVNGVGAWTGATHFQEVAFVFDNTRGLGYENAVAQNPFAGEPGTFGELARRMSRMWVGFVVAGNPNCAGGEFCVLFFVLFRSSSSLVACGRVGLDGNTNGAIAIVGNVPWPKYTLDDPKNIVFDVNVTDLAYVEPDYYRAAGIKYIADRLATAYGR
jgi:triacylglycerol lipase